MEKMTRAEFIKSKQEKRKKRRGISIMLSAEESKEITDRAHSLGLTKTDYVKSILFYSN